MPWEEEYGKTGMVEMKEKEKKDACPRLVVFVWWNSGIPVKLTQGYCHWRDGNHQELVYMRATRATGGLDLRWILCFCVLVSIHFRHFCDIPSYLPGGHCLMPPMALWLLCAFILLTHFWRYDVPDLKSQAKYFISVLSTRSKSNKHTLVLPWGISMILQMITIWEGKDREEMTFCWCWLVY